MVVYCFCINSANFPLYCIVYTIILMSGTRQTGKIFLKNFIADTSFFPLRPPFTYRKAGVFLAARRENLSGIGIIY